MAFEQVAKRMQQAVQRTTEQVKKSTKRLAMDELNLLGEYGQSFAQKMESSRKKAKETLKYLRDVNVEINILLVEQEQSWNRLIRQAANAFLRMGKSILDSWKVLLDGMGIQWKTFSGFLSQAWMGVWESVLKPVWQSIAQMVSSLWNDHFFPLYQKFAEFLTALGKLFGSIWSGCLQPFLQSLCNVLSPIAGTVLSGIGNGFYRLLATIADFASGGMTVLTGLCEFLNGVFTGRWSMAWSGVFQIFNGVWQSISAVGKGVVNQLINLINVFLGAFDWGVNGTINAINRIRLDIPGWVPVFGGKSIGFHLANVPVPKIPMLANGGVIRQPTLAMLGEYQGAQADPEIAAPQSILKKTMAEELNQLAPFLQQMVELLKEQNENRQNVRATVVLDGQELYQNNEKYRLAKGYPVGMNPNFR